VTGLVTVTGFFTLPQLEKELTLRFERKGKEFDMTLAPVSSDALKTLLYDRMGG
jgi:hypothetical protein